MASAVGFEFLNLLFWQLAQVNSTYFALLVQIDLLGECKRLIGAKLAPSFAGYHVIRLFRFFHFNRVQQAGLDFGAFYSFLCKGTILANPHAIIHDGCCLNTLNRQLCHWVGHPLLLTLYVLMRIAVYAFWVFVFSYRCTLIRFFLLLTFLALLLTFVFWIFLYGLVVLCLMDNLILGYRRLTRIRGRRVWLLLAPLNRCSYLWRRLWFLCLASFFLFLHACPT